MLYVAGLFYAVYFTELGRPESSESSKNITIYNKIAIPTIFVIETQVPSLELDRAYASEDLLKFAIKIRGLETNENLSEWICDPHITVDKPFQYQLSSRELGPVYEAAGEFIRATYEYKVDVGNYDSLRVNLDLTIGPCGEHFNFQETNLTPSVMLNLIGNDHLSFQVPVKIITPTPSLTLKLQSTALAT